MAAKAIPQFTLWSDRWEFHNGRYKLSAIHQVTTFKNAAGFERATSQFSTNKVPIGCSLHVFKQGIPPVYDHPKNCSGGHFKLQAVQPQAANELWAKLTEFFITAQFPHPNHVNGITYMKKQHARGIKVWLSKSLDNRLVSDVKKFIQSHLPPQQFINFKFCPHKYILQTLLRQSGEQDQDVGRVSGKQRGRPRGGRAGDEEGSQPGYDPDDAPEDFGGSMLDLASVSGASFFSESTPGLAGPYPGAEEYAESFCLEGALDGLRMDSSHSTTPAASPLTPYTPLMGPAPCSPSPTPYAPEWVTQPYPEMELPPRDGGEGGGPSLYGATASPLERLREKFSRLYADRPLPPAPVATMSELLLLGNQAEAE